MFCDNCGKEIGEGNRYCRFCGAEQWNYKKTIKTKCSCCSGTMVYEESSNKLICNYCGNQEILTESDDVVREKIRVNAKKQVELEKEKNRYNIEKSINKVVENREASDAFKKSKLSKFIILSAFISMIFAMSGTGHIDVHHYEYIVGTIIAFIQMILFIFAWLLGVRLVVTKNRNMLGIVLFIAYIMIIPYMMFLP